MGPKYIGVMTLTFQGHVRHQPRDYSIRHMPFFSIDGQLLLSLCISNYLTGHVTF